MSLINQMLRDLETRRADSGEKASLPNDVRPLPEAANTGSGWKRFLVTSVGITTLAALVWGSVEIAARPPATPSLAAPPVPPEPALKLDNDITLERLRSPVVSPPAQPFTVPPAPPEPAPQARIARPAQAEESPPARVEKRPPATDNNGTPTQRAREQLNAGQRDAAEATLRQALAATPGHVAARQMLFALLMEQRRGDEALALLKEGLALLPEQTQWASNAARLQMDRGEVAGAWETLQHSLPAAAAQGEYRAFCGAVLARLKRHDEAVGHYQAALRTNPAEGRWWTGMAMALEADGKLPESREAFARAQTAGKLPPELAAYVESKLK